MDIAGDDSKISTLENGSHGHDVHDEHREILEHNGFCYALVPHEHQSTIRMSVITWCVFLASISAIGSTFAMSFSFGRFGEFHSHYTDCGVCNRKFN